jgi:catechol 2,3-dioxygenase-like lactoylglutathione lyase family enzyme
MVRIGTVVLHVTDVRRAAQFWTDALGYEVLNSPVNDDETPVLAPRDSHGPSLALDDEDRTHLDLHVTGEAEQKAEIERLVALGARRVPWTYPEGANHVVLQDPEGNLFCIVDTARD